MKRKTRIIVGVVVVIAILGVSSLFLYKSLKKPKTLTQKEEFHVVILDSEEYFYSDSGIKNGIEMALKTVEEQFTIPISYELVDDEGSYVNGIAKAKSLAKDDTVDAVISFQNFSSIESEVKFFEDAKKPFLVTMGCYDEVSAQGYDYFITDFLSGQAVGSRLGECIQKQGIKKILTCHSDTIFEKDEIRGLQSVINPLKDTRIYGSMIGPYNAEEVSNLLVQCDLLDIDGIVVNFYEQQDSAWLLSELRKANKDITLLGDYALDSSEILNQYGKDLEGVYIVPAYPYEESSKLDQFIKEYEDHSNEKFSTAAVQYYDLFCMLASACQKEGKKLSGTDIMKNIKTEEGYDGVAGQIMFDEKGALHTKICPVFQCHNGKFTIYDTLEDSKK